jgi:proteic killer suppression protein
MLFSKTADRDSKLSQPCTEAPVERQRSERIRPDQLGRVSRVLAELDAAVSPHQLDLPGFRCHALHGRPTRYSVTITRTWRITFEWKGEDAARVDFEDYH